LLQGLLNLALEWFISS